MLSLGIFLYCAAMGFVIAGTVSTFYQWITSERAQFLSGRQTILGLIGGIAVTMFGGPFIIARFVLAGLRSRELQPGLALAAAAVGAMWSLFAGIFFVGLLVAA